MHIHKAQRRGVERRAGDGFVEVELPAEAGGRRDKNLGGPQFSPGLRPVFPDHPSRGHGGSVKGPFHPVLAGLVGGLPGIVGAVLNVSPVLERDNEPRNQAGVARFGVLDQHPKLIIVQADGEPVNARFEIGGNAGLAHLAPTVVPGLGREPQQAVDSEFHAVVGGGA